MSFISKQATRPLKHMYTPAVEAVRGNVLAKAAAWLLCSFCWRWQQNQRPDLYTHIHYCTETWVLRFVLSCCIGTMTIKYSILKFLGFFLVTNVIKNVNTVVVFRSMKSNMLKIRLHLNPMNIVHLGVTGFFVQQTHSLERRMDSNNQSALQVTVKKKTKNNPLVFCRHTSQDGIQ